MDNAFKGLIIGALLGALIGLVICVWVITETWLFPGDTMVIGATFCGICGYLWGEEFFDALLDFWRHLF